MRLLDERLDVWRPALAERLRGDIYRIVDQPYDRETEQWEFTPGDEVVCEVIESSDGRMLAAIRRSSMRLVTAGWLAAEGAPFSSLRKQCIHSRYRKP